jgi:hypothetical protein
MILDILFDSETFILETPEIDGGRISGYIFEGSSVFDFNFEIYL